MESSRAGFPYHSQPSQMLHFTINLSRFFFSTTSLICGLMSLNQKASLSQNTRLIPHNTAIGGCRTTIASLQLLPKLLNLSSGPSAHAKQRGWVLRIFQQKHKDSELTTGGNFTPCVCVFSQLLQNTTAGNSSCRFALHTLRPLHWRKNICWTSFRLIWADNLNAVLSDRCRGDGNSSEPIAERDAKF